MNWKRSATPANRAWWVLTMSAPTTSASAHGSSATIPNNSPGLVGTPIRKIGRRSPEFVSGRALTMTEALHLATLPTPMATDGMTDGGAGSTYPLRMILATPRKSDAERGGRGDVLSQLQGHASRHAGMMPTPVKPNGGRTLSRQEIETGKRSNGAKAQIDTPNLLRHAAEILPTPTKRDSRMDGWSPAYDRRKSPTMDAVINGAMTDRAPDKWAGARALAVMLRSHGLTGTAALPITYGWMMGFPPGWLTRALRSAVAKGLLLPA
ncbi:hypothetical protein [Nitrobacter sp.]|uniref:hypothetical protein n=1 Tax=Nitrobacter sp. TaxID=29420 RepID=UPI0029CAAD0F|nr:hypothetical protein [Nitrobacter sp.]